MAKHALKILRYEHHKIFKYVWPFYNIMHERVKFPIGATCLILLKSSSKVIYVPKCGMIVYVHVRWSISLRYTFSFFSNKTF